MHCMFFAFVYSLEDCASISHQISDNLKSSHGHLVDFFFFGHSDCPEKRSLVQQRKNVSWFNSEVTFITTIYKHAMTNE